MVTNKLNEYRGNASSLDTARILAPKDCRIEIGLRSMITESRKQLRVGTREFVLDLSIVEHMNARLLATVLLLTREVRRAGGHLRLEGASIEFRKWARTFHLLRHLERRGIIEKDIVQPSDIT